MNKFLLPENGSFFKANLHCHSNISDGYLSPQQLKDIYVEKGYSIIAFTDHDIMLSHSYLNDESFLALNGYEMEITEQLEDETLPRKNCHICLIALDPDNLTQVCYHRSKYLFGNAPKHRHKIVYDKEKPDFERVYSADGINQIFETGRNSGFFVTYNHPTWSMETYEQYSKYHHMHAMEICNFGCMAMGYAEYNERVYDEMLRGGERICCIATDDNHNYDSADSRFFDSFGGFTVIKAPRLEYKAVTDALVAGHFYASQGPEIYSLLFEDGKLHITCSEADRIMITTGRRRAWAAYASEGKALTEAEFDVMPEDIYVRLTVIDKNGYPANTNAYFTDELFSE